MTFLTSIFKLIGELFQLEINHRNTTNHLFFTNTHGYKATLPQNLKDVFQLQRLMDDKSASIFIHQSYSARLSRYGLIKVEVN